MRGTEHSCQILWGDQITVEQSTTPAGWYIDPAGSTSKRWWDGVQWTAHLQAATPPPPVPVPVPVPVPQQIAPERVDPYAQANPYGLPVVQERPYIPMQNGGAISRAPYAPARPSGGRPLIGSVIVGAIAFCLSLVGLVPGSPVFYYSAGGIFAIIGGARTLMRNRGAGSRVAPIAAIVLGSLAVIFMVIGIAIHTTATVSYGTNGSGAQTDTGSVTAALPSAPTFSTDPTLSQYEQSASKLATAIYGTYSGGQVSPTTPNWPASLTELSGGTVTFPSGTAAVTLPSDESVKYVVSDDGKYFDVAISGGPRNEAAIYDSESNKFTWECAAGAPATCPAGGISPDSGTSGSNS